MISAVLIAAATFGSLSVSNLVITGWSNVATPTGWTWEIPFTIEQQGTNFQPHNFDLFTYSGIPSNGKSYYVSTTGNDSAAGTNWATAWASISKPRTVADAVIVYITNGIYAYGQHGAKFGGYPSAWIGVGGMVTNTLDQQFYAPTWTWAVASNHYMLDIASRVAAGVWDVSIITSNGVGTAYSLATNVTQVDVTPGYFYKDGGGMLHMRTLDSRVPDSSIKCWGDFDNNFVNEGAKTQYVSNITFEDCGSDQRLFQCFINSTGQVNRVYASNCWMTYSSSVYDNVILLGTTEAIFFNCTTAGGNKDGFNYHHYKGTTPNGIEYGCVAYGMGTPGGNTDNGSTMHEGGQLVRIMGNYSRTYGSVIGDVGENTRVWNLGVISWGSRAGAVTSRGGFLVDTGATNWLDSCYSYDVGYDLIANLPGDTMLYRNMVTTNHYGSGSFQTY